MNNLKTHRQQRALRQADVAKSLGITTAAVSRHEQNLDLTEMRRKDYVGFYNVPLLELFPEEDPNNPADGKKRFKIISYIKAGESNQIWFDEIGESETVFAKPSQEGLFLLVKGDSMAPAIDDGSLIFIDFATEGDVANNDYAVVLLNNGETGVIKQVQYKNGKVVLHSINSKYKDITIRREDIYKMYPAREQRRPKAISKKV